MKGTIDITIKRKDGTIEKRQEHNVAFDLPAFIIKEWAKDSALPIMTSRLGLAWLKTIYQAISLSEEERDLTKPSWRPRTLKTITSGTTSWHTVLASATNNGKKRTVTAAWTMPDDVGFSLTLKSIAFDNPNMYASRPSNVSSTGADSGVYEDGFVYASSGGSYYFYALGLEASNFSQENAYFGGLSGTKITSSNISKYVPYFMNLTKTVDGVQQRTQDGRWGFVKSNGDPFVTLVPGTSLSDKIVIYDRKTQEIALSFPLSQFTNYDVNMYAYVYVINTGTKNWLFQYDSSINASRIWQIPDTQTSAAIAPTSETFMQGIALQSQMGNSSYQGAFVIGNYFINNNIAYRIDDDLTVTTFHGEERNSYGSPIGKMNKDYVQWYVSSNESNDTVPYFANLTASNFSTPITLAAGDVLSVSYSINVA